MPKEVIGNKILSPQPEDYTFDKDLYHDDERYWMEGDVTNNIRNPRIDREKKVKFTETEIEKMYVERDAMQLINQLIQFWEQVEVNGGINPYNGERVDPHTRGNKLAPLKGLKGILEMDNFSGTMGELKEKEPKIYKVVINKIEETGYVQ